MSQGHPELLASIATEIRASGPLTFARFMELALYEPTCGYYMRHRDASPPIGWEGDYYTTSDVHPVFARALARQLLEIDSLLGQPKPFTLVEMGPGKGLFARDLLTALASLDRAFTSRLRCLLIERSPAMRARQEATLASVPSLLAQLSWAEALGQIETGSLVGMLFSNELLDAFPVHRVSVDRGELKEIHVDITGGEFRERLLPLSTPALSHYLSRAAVEVQEGQTAEINLKAMEWLDEVARVLGKGIVVTVDYGHTAQDLYGQHPRGTLLCYHRHRVYENPYERVGLQDMTSHVDFTSLATRGEEQGLHITGYTNHMGFLTGLGIEETLQALDPESPEYRSVIELIRPQGMGRTFKILIQHKGIERPALAGLTYKPFFDLALTPSRSTQGHGLSTLVGK